MWVRQDMQQFWMVQGDGPARVRHSSRAIAEREAQRLARENPGAVFYVMEAVAGHRKIDVERVDFGRPLDDGIPF